MHLHGGVEVRDGLNQHRVPDEDEDADDTVTVTIEVLDEDEPPAAPTVTVTAPGNGLTLEVVWDVPAHTGSDITGYDVEYGTGNTFSSENVVITARTAIIPSLTADTSYTVRVRARSDDEGPSAWSRTVTVKTNKADNKGARI